MIGTGPARPTKSGRIISVLSVHVLDARLVLYLFYCTWVWKNHVTAAWEIYHIINILKCSSCIVLRADYLMTNADEILRVGTKKECTGQQKF